MLIVFRVPWILIGGNYNYSSFDEEVDRGDPGQANRD